LNQANIVISEIKNETVTTKKVLLESEAQAKKDLKFVLNEHSTLDRKSANILEIKQINKLFLLY
jgi:hypothetical protein